MVRHIEMTIKIDGKVVTTSLPERAYSTQSGVRLLLELDPTSTVTVTKADGLIITYKYKDDGKAQANTNASCCTMGG